MDNRKLSLGSRNYDVHTLDSKSMETVNSVGSNNSQLQIEYDAVEIKTRTDHSMLANDFNNNVNTNSNQPFN